MKTKNTEGAVFTCGGVISETQHEKNVKKYGVWADAMSWVMRDDKYAEYVELSKAGKEKEATKIFEKYARSQI